MGNTHSSASNTINSYVQQCLNVSSSAVQNCSTQLTNTEGLQIIGTDGNVTISNVDWSQISQVKMDCLADQKTTQTLQSQISQAMSQNATAITQALSANLNTQTDTQNIMNNVEQLGQTIASTFVQECTQNAVQNQSIKVKDTKGNVTVNNLNWSQVSASVSSCVQKTAAVASLTSTIENSLGQTAKSVEKNILDFLNSFMFILIAIVLGVLFFMYKTVSSGANVLTSPWFYVGVFAIVDMYFVAGYFYGWKPYDPPRILPLDQQAADQHNRKIIIPVAIVSGVMVLLFGLWIYWYHTSGPAADTSANTSAYPSASGTLSAAGY
jgi:hypothetical protein